MKGSARKYGLGIHEEQPIPDTQTMRAGSSPSSSTGGRMRSGPCRTRIRANGGHDLAAQVLHERVPVFTHRAASMMAS